MIELQSEIATLDATPEKHSLLVAVAVVLVTEVVHLQHR